jgi:hypothetical protein
MEGFVVPPVKNPELFDFQSQMALHIVPYLNKKHEKYAEELTLALREMRATGFAAKVVQKISKHRLVETAE